MIKIFNCFLGKVENKYFNFFKPGNGLKPNYNFIF